MKKRLICLSLIFAMTATQVVPVAAARKDEAQVQKSTTQSKLSDAQERVDALQSQKSILMSQISSKQQELVGVMTQVNMLNESIQNKEADIQATQVQLEEAVAERDKQYEDMKKRIQYLYEKGGNTSWAQALLESRSIADMLSKMETSQQVYDYDREALQKLRDAVQAVQDLEDQLETEKAELESSRQEQEGVQQSLESQMAGLKSSASDYDAQIASAQAQAQQYQQLIQEQNAELQLVQGEKKAAVKDGGQTSKKSDKTSTEKTSNDEKQQVAQATVAQDETEETKGTETNTQKVPASSAAEIENSVNDNTVSQDKEEVVVETPAQPEPEETPADTTPQPVIEEEEDTAPQPVVEEEEDTASQPESEQPQPSQPVVSEEEPSEDVSYNSNIGQAIVAYAEQFIGNPYVYGGNSLTNGIDCSGFTQQIYAHFGYSLPRTSDAQAYVGTEVSWSESKAGDLIVYPGHVAILTGDGGIVHASNSAPYPKGGIKYTSNALYTSYITIRRIAQ